MSNLATRRRRSPFRHVPVAILLGLAGCATVPDPRAPQDPVGAAVTQPFRDLSLVQGRLPHGLTEVAAEPYRPLRTCPAILAGLAELDAWLGPDIDGATGQGQDAVVGFVGDVVSGAASLPFRGVVRRLSGAHRRDRDAAAVILAAMVRRGFLKGERAALGCADAGA